MQREATKEWSEFCSAHHTVEERLLRKVAQLEATDEWKQRPVFGGAIGSVEAFVKLNLGVWGTESRKMCSHIRPPTSRLEPYFIMLVGSMSLYYSLFISFAIGERRGPLEVQSNFRKM